MKNPFFPFNIEQKALENSITYGNSPFLPPFLSYTNCPKCKAQVQKKDYFASLLIDSNKQTWFCRACGFNGCVNTGENTDKKLATNPIISESVLNHGLTKNILDWFGKRGITQTTLTHFKVCVDTIYLPQKGQQYPVFSFPYYKNNTLVNLVHYGKARGYEVGGERICYNYDNINDEHTYITLNELEVLTLFECGIYNAISLFGGEQDNSDTSTGKHKILDFLSNIERRLLDVKKVTIVLPKTPRNKQITEDLARRIGKEKTWFVEIDAENKTLNDIFIQSGKLAVTQTLNTATTNPISGIILVSDIKSELDHIYDNGFKRGESTGWLGLDEYYTVMPGQWTVVTGIPNHGKSSFLDSLFINLAKNQDWRFGVFSPENQPVSRYYAGLIEKYTGAPFDLGKSRRINSEDKDSAAAWLNDHFYTILPDEESGIDCSIDSILSLARSLVLRFGIKGLIIDPWNEIEHSRPPNQTETEYVSSVLSKVRKFARIYDVHIWLVAHPSKLYKDKDGKYPVPTPYDISGSAHYRNKADNALTVWRNLGGNDQGITDIHIQKIRFKEVGRVGLYSLRFDQHTGNFVDDVDQYKRRKSLEDGIVLMTEEYRER